MAPIFALVLVAVEYPAIAEILDARAYHTVAVSASTIVRATPSDYNPTGGFDRGFDTFVEGCVWRRGACLSGRIERQLDDLEEPYFLYLHYMEPHAPYEPPERYTRRFAGDYEGYDFIREGDPNPIGRMLYADGPEYEIGELEIDHLIDLYDEEIRYFDGVFRRLLATLDQRGLLDRTLIVLPSDDGEEFLEHGHIKHCRGLWDTVTRVPLILGVPGMMEGRRSSQGGGAACPRLPGVRDHSRYPKARRRSRSRSDSTTSPASVLEPRAFHRSSDC